MKIGMFSDISGLPSPHKASYGEPVGFVTLETQQALHSAAGSFSVESMWSSVLPGSILVFAAFTTTIPARNFVANTTTPGSDETLDIVSVS